MKNYHIAIPGPYTVSVSRDGVDDLLILHTDEKEPVHIARHDFWNHYTPDRIGPIEATFRLLAAAPTLRDQLTRLCEVFEQFQEGDASLDKLELLFSFAKLQLDHVNAPTERCRFLIPTCLNAENV